MKSDKYQSLVNLRERPRERESERERKQKLSHIYMTQYNYWSEILPLTKRSSSSQDNLTTQDKTRQDNLIIVSYRNLDTFLFFVSQSGVHVVAVLVLPTLPKQQNLWTKRREHQ